MAIALLAGHDAVIWYGMPSPSPSPSPAALVQFGRGRAAPDSHSAGMARPGGDPARAETVPSSFAFARRVPQECIRIRLKDGHSDDLDSAGGPGPGAHPDDDPGVHPRGRDRTPTVENGSAQLVGPGSLDCAIEG